jgi:hypothetical protein
MRILLPFIHWARWGFAARGITYFIMAWFALMAALGAGRPEDARNALVEVVWQPFGRTLVVLLALGFAGHAAWRIAQALLDLEKHGCDLRGYVLRGAQLAGATLAFSLGLFAATAAIAVQPPSPGNETDDAFRWTAWLLSLPLGRWLLAGVGLSILSMAAGQIWGGYSLSFRRNLQGSPAMINAICWMGRIGLFANAGLLVLVGIFFVSAAWYADTAESGGILTALEVLWRQPAAPWLLGAVALGLSAFGLFSLGLALFRRIDRDHMATRLRAAAGRVAGIEPKLP